MNKVEAIVRYMGRVDESILAEYEDADKYIYINDSDEDLQKWRIEMPKPPEWHLIDGFGLPARQQKFTYEEYPEKLKQLEDDIRSEILRSKKDGDSKDSVERAIYDRKWEVLDIGREQYADIIKWIKRQWFHRLYGKWYFIKGKPTYLSGWNFMYLSYYLMEGGTDWDGKPEYRWRDMKWFHAVQYCFNTTETVYKDKDGNVEFLEDGTLRMRNMGSRTALGANVNKGRRVGDTSKTKDIDICETTSSEEFMSGMQADTDTNAENLYHKLTRYSFHKLPFFFTPETPNSKTSKQISLRGTGAGEGLQSFVTFRASGEYAYDGSRINFYHGDEIGKTKNADIIKRHEVVSRTLSPGVKIRGYMIYTSTAEEMDSETGKNFEDFSGKSMFENRGVDGRTETGLINIYFPIEESIEGFIDCYGYPIIENTSDLDVIESMAFIERNENGEVMGARDYLDNKEAEYIKREDLVGLSSFQRKNPRTYRDCFANAAFNLMFDRIKLQAILSKLKYEGNKCVQGNFINVNDKVHFVPSEEGRFIVSMQLPESRSSRMIFDGTTKRPEFDNVFVASGDTFKASKTDSRRKSLGSGAVLYKHDSLIDDPNKPVSEWDTKKFVCTYQYRDQTVDGYCQDMLNMCIYYGALMYPENDLPAIQEYFDRHGYSGYLLFDVDLKTNKKKDSAGWTNSGRGRDKEQLFNYGYGWVNLHSENCDHPEIIDEFLKIKSFEDMKNRDLFVSITGCLRAEQSTYIDRMRRFNTTKVDIGGFYPKK